MRASGTSARYWMPVLILAGGLAGVGAGFSSLGSGAAVVHAANILTFRASRKSITISLEQSCRDSREDSVDFSRQGPPSC